MDDNEEAAESAAYHVLTGGLVLFAAWMILSSLRVTRSIEQAFDNAVPAPVVVANLILLPFWLIISSARRATLIVRVLLGIVFICSIVLMEITFRRYLAWSYIIMAVLFVEVYWVIPKLRRGQKSEQIQS
jgi:hypothetical protein